MFLFLSKVLPLFFYPLGFATVLLGIALLLGWKRSRWTPYPLLLALLAILLSSNAWVSHYLMRSLEQQIVPPLNLPQADAIVVLGGATKSPVAPRPMVDLNEHGDRLLYALKLYQEQKAPLIIVAGGRISWSGNTRSEAEDMANILELIGIPPSAILQESKSLNTYQNAVNVQKILKNQGIDKIILVTSAFHLPRSLLIFQKLGISVIPAPTDFFVTVDEAPPSLEGIILGILPDAHRLSLTTLALKEYVGMIVYRLRGWL